MLQKSGYEGRLNRWLWETMVCPVSMGVPAEHYRLGANHVRLQSLGHLGHLGHPAHHLVL